MKTVLVAFSLLLFCAGTPAQQSKDGHSTPAQQSGTVPATTPGGGDPNAEILAAAETGGDEAQARWEAGYRRLTAAQEDYATFSLQHAEDAYRWQHLSTQIIFAVVVLLMLAGILFSWMQFRQGLHHQGPPIGLISTKVLAQGEASAGGTLEKEAVTEFSASPQGIKVASSTLGVIILVISMCFFYMYLRYVYPISVENANRAVTEVQKATGKGR